MLKGCRQVPVEDQSLVFDAKTIAIEPRHHVHSVALQHLVPVDDIFAYHIHEVAKMGGAVRERWSCMHDPSLSISVLATVILVVVEFVCDERQDRTFSLWIRLSMVEFSLQQE